LALAAHRSFRRFRAELAQRSPPIPWKGPCFRVAAEEWSRSHDLFSGAGAARTGGRWNRPGLRAAYAALDPELALQEWLAQVRRAGLRAEQCLPTVLAWGEVELESVLDLTGPGAERIGVQRDELVTVDWEAENRASRECLPQAIGRAARLAGYEALLVPSAATLGANLVIFPDRLRARSRVRAHGLKGLRTKDGPAAGP